MMMAQLAGRNSLRDIVENTSAQAHRLYHLGSTKLSRSNLSRLNSEKPYSLGASPFQVGRLLLSS
jgi:putative transposase